MSRAGSSSRHPVSRADLSKEDAAVDLGIAGKVVLFTGGSKGMGRIAAKMLADEGCAVAIVARSPGPVAEAVNKIVADGGSRIGGTPGISQPDQASAAVDPATRRLVAPSIRVRPSAFNSAGHI